MCNKFSLNVLFISVLVLLFSQRPKIYTAIADCSLISQ
uniref:Uncharacterized protein n=1 Tax=Rhizophora mucronata TaxID=61149 RepID=A0A2P2QUM4_RHIMU